MSSGRSTAESDHGESRADVPPRERLLRIVVADDSAMVRQLYAMMLNGERDMVVVGIAATGRECVELVRQHRPDLVLADLFMPDGDGIEATRQIMAIAPTPTVIVTTRPLGPGSEAMFEGLEAGAIEVIVKPDIYTLWNDARRDPFLRALRAAAEVHVIGRKAKTVAPAPEAKPKAEPSSTDLRTARLVAIGASTGGPPCLRTVLGSLSAGAPPVLVVQHMGADFIAGFARWLGDATSLAVEVATHGAIAQPGRVYIAPGNRHLVVLDGSRTLGLSDGPAVWHQRPSVDVLFESVAKHVGRDAVGIVLTGMGDDGARGLQAMRGGGAFTVAQDESSSVATGMPREAARRGAARLVAPPHQIAAVIGGLRDPLRSTRP